VKLFAKPTDPLSIGDTACTSDEWLKAWKVNDWNTAKVRVVGNPPQITTWINGLKSTNSTARSSTAKATTPKGRRDARPSRLNHRSSPRRKGWPNGAKCRWRIIKVNACSAFYLDRFLDSLCGETHQWKHDCNLANPTGWHVDYNNGLWEVDPVAELIPEDDHLGFLRKTCCR